MKHKKIIFRCSSVQEDINNKLQTSVYKKLITKAIYLQTQITRDH